MTLITQSKIPGSAHSQTDPGVFYFSVVSLSVFEVRYHIDTLLMPSAQKLC